MMIDLPGIDDFLCVGLVEKYSSLLGIGYLNLKQYLFHTSRWSIRPSFTLAVTLKRLNENS